MSERCFKISGNFQQYGEWHQPGPGFEGYIVVGKNGMFEGCDSSSRRFLVGSLRGNKKTVKLVYCSLARDVFLFPLLYGFDNVSSLGKWVPIDTYCRPSVEHAGLAEVNIEPVDLADEIMAEIQSVKEYVLEKSELNQGLFGLALSGTYSDWVVG